MPRFQRSRLRELPHLRDRDQLLRARRGGDEVLERVRVPEHLQRGAADLLAEPLLQRLLRVDRDRPQLRRELDLLLGPHALARERARHPVLLGDLAHDRAPARPRGGQARRRGDGRLSDSTLAGDVQQRPIPQQRVHRSHPMTMGSWTRRLREGYETVTAHAAPP